MNKETSLIKLISTVGYSESDDRTEFLKGAGMMYDLMFKVHCEEISIQAEDIQTLTELNKEYLHDLKELSSIVLRYGERT